MVIDDLDACRAPGLEPEADPPLIVDADAPLTPTVALQGLEPVVGRNTHFLDMGHAVQDGQLAQRDRLETDETRHASATEQRLGVLAGKR